MKNVFLFLTFWFLISPAFAQTRNFKIVKAPTENLSTEKRKAIVIGMSDYGAGRSLDNTLNDADDMSDVLMRLGFEVTLIKNNDLRNLRTNLINWYNAIEGNDMAVFYFAGHGLEVGGQNYLVPVDAEMNSQTDVEYATLNVNQVLGNMDEKRVGMKLLILDACRDNPFTRSWNQGRGSNTQGLAGMSAPRGTYIAFAASPGSTAQDGGNYNLRNGVFTHFILQEIIKTGATIDEIFNKVTGGVSNMTLNQQTPFKNSSLTASFYFIPPRNDNPPPNNPTVAYNENPPPPNNNPSPNNPTPAPAINIAELIREADTHYDNKRYNDAVALYRQVAEQGNYAAQNQLGNCYYNGYGIIKDYKQAVEWYRKSAEQGYAAAQDNLGECYYYGNGVAKNLNQAAQWYRKAAEQGHAGAQDHLGYCYDQGEGVAKDLNQAAQWYRKGAEQGHARAQMHLGICYYNGEGVSQNYNQAVLWFKKAADQGDAKAQNNLGACYQSGNGIAQNRDQAVYWYKKAADQGEETAISNLRYLGIRYP